MRKKIAARIQAALERQGFSTPTQDTTPEVEIVEHYTPHEVGQLLKLHPDTIRQMMQDESEGVIRIGNRNSTQYKRRYVTERYSPSAVKRLFERLAG